ncbi:hypothetical protein LINPERPRIM_LOCUS6537 [Linum perenne]
MIQLFYY